MGVYITLKVGLEGDEDTLVMALKWLLENKLLKKRKNLWTEVFIDDLHRYYAETIFNPRSWEDVDSIHGTIEFGYEARVKLNLPKAVGFTAELTEIPTPKGRYVHEGVKITLEEPINKAYFIKGSETKEFKLVKVESV